MSTPLLAFRSPTSSERAAAGEIKAEGIFSHHQSASFVSRRFCSSLFQAAVASEGWRREKCFAVLVGI